MVVILKKKKLFNVFYQILVKIMPFFAQKFK